MEPTEKADLLYNQAMVWCKDLPEDQRLQTVKSILDFICKEIIKEHCTTPSVDEIMFWVKVRKEINNKTNL